VFESSPGGSERSGKIMDSTGKSEIIVENSLYAEEGAL
jgi:hypothetical protein